jgi:hypothetical protein
MLNPRHRNCCFPLFFFFFCLWFMYSHIRTTNDKNFLVAVVKQTLTCKSQFDFWIRCFTGSFSFANRSWSSRLSIYQDLREWRVERRSWEPRVLKRSGKLKTVERNERLSWGRSWKMPVASCNCCKLCGHVRNFAWSSRLNGPDGQAVFGPDSMGNILG